MAKMKKVIYAGPLVIEAVYPIPGPKDSTAARARKKKLSSEAQRRCNDRQTEICCECLLACNVQKGDLFCTLTYRDEDLPVDRAKATRHLQRYLRKLRTKRRGQGTALH